MLDATTTQENSNNNMDVTYECEKEATTLTAALATVKDDDDKDHQLDVKKVFGAAANDAVTSKTIASFVTANAITKLADKYKVNHIEATITTDVAAIQPSGCFEMSIVEDNITFVNCYYRLGGSIKKFVGAQTVIKNEVKNKTIAIKIDTSSLDTTQKIEIYNSIDACITKSTTDNACIIIPLYLFDANCNVETDFRSMPMIQAIDVVTVPASTAS